MKPIYRICFSHNTVWFYSGETIACSYMRGGTIYFDHRSGQCKLKWAKNILQ